MRRLTLGGLGMGMGVLLAASGCSGGDPAPGSTIGQPKGGSGGMAGTAGSLNLGGPAGAGAGGGGAGGGGAGGTAGVIGASGASGGATLGGTTGSGGGGGSSLGGSGSGGSKPAGMCKRATASDAECADFDPTTPQAYACDDPGAYITLNGMHGSNCYSVNFVAGSKYGGCCPP
jgi:hypothetical protein